MLEASFWVFVFVAIVVAAMSVRRRVRDDKTLQGWYQHMVKNRLDLVKKIVIYGTLILWVGIWLATRGDEKASVGSLLRDISNSWNKPESPISPTPEPPKGPVKEPAKEPAKE